MSLLTHDEVRDLIVACQTPKVSLYLPTYRAGKQTLEAPVRLKNLLRDAEARLTHLNMPPERIQAMLRPALALLEESPFWHQQLDTLALFIADGMLRRYRLPVHVDPMCVVGANFHVKPLLGLLSGDGRFYILTLSPMKARVLVASRHSVEEIEIPGMPTNMQEALQLDTQKARNQLHAEARQKTGGDRPAMFHGHGSGEDDLQLQLMHYFHHIDRALLDHIGRDGAPLVLAGVESMISLYRRATDHKHVMNRAIGGAVEDARPDALQKQAWPIVQPFFMKDQEGFRREFSLMESRGQASNDLREILPAAHSGRVGVLFSAAGGCQWGRFNESTSEVEMRGEPRPGDEDLLNIAAIHTFRNSGQVFAVDTDQVPGAYDVAAVYRY